MDFDRRYPDIDGDPKKDIDAVVKFRRLRANFPPSVLAEAKAAAKGLASPGKRLDLRRKFIFTCDPETAKDYDDALSIEKDSRGRRVLGVHIADVSHFVRPGSAMDKEALRRGNSVYFPGRVLPMLPEALSNSLCSLVPGEDRLAFSVFIVFDDAGNALKASFAKSVINSKARFEYDEVTAALRGKPGRIPKRHLAALKEINRLALQLRARRFALGALDLETPEYEIVLDEAGEMTGIAKRPYDESHIMIEECMVAANEAVAAELWRRGVKIPARFHDAPDEEKLRILRAELGGMGVRTGNIENRAVFSQFLASIKKHPLYQTIAMMVLRSMKRAVYDPANMGHFGLAKRYYAHFTSPIRRYADLVLHRELADFLAGSKPRIPMARLKSICEHLNEAEETAAEAERDVAEMKKYRYLMEPERMRGAYGAVVSKCMPFGCFVDIPDIGVSGLVHISVLSDRYVRFNESDGTLSAPGGGSWRPGDRMEVVVGNVDAAHRKIDFIPVRERPKGASRANGGGRRAKNRKGGKKWN